MQIRVSGPNLSFASTLVADNQGAFHSLRLGLAQHSMHIVTIDSLEARPILHCKLLMPRCGNFERLTPTQCQAGQNVERPSRCCLDSHIKTVKAR